MRNHGLSSSKALCSGCGRQMTWEQQRRQYGRLLRAGKAPVEAKALTPRCQKCVTAAVREVREVRGFTTCSRVRADRLRDL
jgi:hypothetical protein